MNTKTTTNSIIDQNERVLNTPTTIRSGYSILAPLVNNNSYNSLSFGANKQTYYTHNSDDAGNIKALINEVTNKRIPKLFFTCCNKTTFDLATREQTNEVLQSLLDNGFNNMWSLSCYDGSMPTYYTQNSIFVSNTDGEFYPLFSDTQSNNQTTRLVANSDAAASLPDYSRNLLTDVRGGKYYLQMGQGTMQLSQTETAGPWNSFYYDGSGSPMNFISFKIRGSKQLGFSFTFNPAPTGVMESWNSNNKVSKLQASTSDDVYMMYINWHNVLDEAVKSSSNAEVANTILAKASMKGLSDNGDKHYTMPTLCRQDSKLNFSAIISQVVNLLNNTIQTFYNTGVYDNLSIRRGITSIINSYTFPALATFDVLPDFRNYTLTTGIGNSDHMPLLQKVYPYFMMNRNTLLNPSSSIKPVYSIWSSSGNYRAPSRVISMTSWKDYFSNDLNWIIKYNRGFSDTDALIPGSSSVLSKNFGSYVVDTYNSSQTLRWVGSIFISAIVIELE